MARIVLGIGTSHGPLLSMTPEYWGERVKADRANPQLFYDGKTYNFEQLAELRKGENLAAQSTMEMCWKRYAQCQVMIDRLSEIFEEKKPDVAVIVGDDQMEVFTDHISAIAIFWGDYVEGIPRTPELLARIPRGSDRAEPDRTPPVYTQYPCLPDLGRHVIERAVGEGFDVGRLTKLPYGALGNSVPHAYGFIYRRIMRDKVVPHVPVFLNTYYPPNSPTAARCFSFGRALGRAIASWPDDRTVAVIASGGLSHFAIDEPFDQKVIEAMRRNDGDALSNIPEVMFQSGTSEVKNWIAVSGVMTEAGLTMNLLDYIPCYRSEAGTGAGMAFAHWE